MQRWFGYKLHLVVDSNYELPLGFEVTKASVADGPRLLPLVSELARKHGELAKRARELAADKGYDSEENNATLYDEYGVKPIIDTRELWKEEPGKPRVLFGERADVVLYDERGRVYCQAPVERRGGDEMREMAFVGFEFTPIARPTRRWARAYARRGAVERVNARVDRVLGFEEHFIRGQAKMETRVTLGLVVMLAMALGRIRANQAELMRSLTLPVRRAG